MTYTTVMAHLEAGHSNTGLLRVAQNLAERIDVHVIGIAARQPVQIRYGEGYAFGEQLEEDRCQALAQLNAAEAEFRTTLKTTAAGLEWRSATVFEKVCDYLAQEARCADLLITGVASGALLDTSTRVNLGDLVTQLGRPLLVVPDKAKPLNLDWVVVGWTDTREARRAVLDALPMLKLAAHVSLVEITDRDDLSAAGARLDDVAAWLRRHGITAEVLAAPSTDDGTSQLYDIALDQGADLVVAGAYGHSRMQEWVLGGVTHDLLRRAECCSLVSH